MHRHIQRANSKNGLRVGLSVWDTLPLTTDYQKLRAVALKMPFFHYTAHTLGQSDHLREFSPPHYTFTPVHFLNNRASHGSHQIIAVVFNS